jgi:hypothetical protein
LCSLVLFSGSFFTPKSRSKNKKLIVCFTELFSPVLSPRHGKQLEER